MLRVMAAALLITMTLAPAAQGEWPAFHNNERHTGFQAGSVYQPYEDLWWNLTVQPATQIEASPVVSGSTLIVAGWDMKVRAFDTDSGAPKWNATMGTKIVATPVIASNRVFVVDSAGTIKAFDLEKGTELATTSVGATLATPTIHEGKLFIGNDAGQMKAYATEKLDLLWTFTTSTLFEEVKTTTTGTGQSAVTTQACEKPLPTTRIRGAPAIFGGLVVFGSIEQWMFAVNELGTSDGKTTAQWIFKAVGDIFGTPAIDEVSGRMLIGTYDGNVHALPADPNGQTPLYATNSGVQTLCSAYRNVASWTYNVPAEIGKTNVHSSPATDGTRAYFGANNGHVYSVMMSDGSKAWEFTTGDAVISSPAVSNGVVVVGSDDGKVYWLDAVTGAERKSFLADSPVQASPAIEGNRTYAASFDGTVYLLGPAIPRFPDLQVSSVTYDGINVVITVFNAGTRDAVASTLRLTLDGVATDLPVGIIVAGQSASLQHPSVLLEGAHAALAQADVASTVAESNENNNQLETSLVIAPETSKGGGGGGFKIPAPGILVCVLALGLALARRRR